MSSPVTYLDNNATTRVDPRVVEAMTPLLGELYGNPSSVHHFGAQVAGKIEEARACVAKLIGARDSEIIFTSGGTEADNAALRGVLAARPSKKHVVISAVEHHAIFEPCEYFERQGYAVTKIGVDEQGRLDLTQLADSLRADTALISIMLANNETGVVLPVRQVCAIAKEHKVPVHTDAVNALGKMPVNVDDLGVNLLSLSSHKIYGPKGVGALYVRRGTPLRPLMIGGGQERGRRGGTLNAPGIIGLGAACALLAESMNETNDKIKTMRNEFEVELKRRYPDIYVLGEGTERLPNTCCVCFPGLSSEAILLLLSESGICVSSGSACSSGSVEPSHVLLAMGTDPHTAQGEIRFSFGRFNTGADVQRLFEVLPAVLDKVASANI
ncbi:MAG: aminotransferase class V-fold PLP-dependent enzyme [Planctomycetota bacterium]